MIASLRDRFGRQAWYGRLLNNRLGRNIGWMLASQIGNRLLRIGATVVVARMLGPEVYGLAALVLAINEMVHVLSYGGISGKLVQAHEGELKILRDTGYWLNWLLCIGLTLLQIGVAWPLASFYGEADLLFPVICLAFSYLLLPLGTIQAALLIRENRLDVIARVEMSQSIADTLLTLVLALAGLGVWALVLPKLLVVPLWAWQLRRAHNWRPGTRPTLAGWRRIVAFGKHLIWIDLLAALRNNIDYLIIGRVLGVEALGLYYFAFNAGLGLSQGLLRAATTALYPHLCELSQQRDALLARMQKGMRSIALSCVPPILLQAALAPFYVPLLFGADWVERGALPLLIILCLSALPRLVSECGSQLLRAAGQPHADTRAQTAFTVLYGTAIVATAPLGLTAVAWSVLASHLLFAPVFIVWSWRRLRPAAVPLTPVPAPAPAVEN